MHIGMFMEFGFREDGSAETAFREGFALVDAAESWGLDSAWLSEFHFSPDRSVLSPPIVTASAMASTRPAKLPRSQSQGRPGQTSVR